MDLHIFIAPMYFVFHKRNSLDHYTYSQNLFDSPKICIIMSAVLQEMNLNVEVPNNKPVRRKNGMIALKII
jgi:hypothetical protein